MITTIKLFNVFCVNSNTVRGYLVLFNEITIGVANPNQEMFMGIFQNILKSVHFNECLTEKLTDNM